MRRHLLISQVLAASPLRPVILLLAEAREAGAFALPPGVDAVSLPAIRKDGDGLSRPRHLGIPLQNLVALRAEIIRSALRAFGPDVFLVDHLPRGAVGELDPALATLRAEGRTRCLLGLRDILDAPDTVRREWKRWGNVDAITEHYDAVWIYGDPTVYDLIREYRFPDVVARKSHSVGYLDSRKRLECEPTSGGHLIAALGLPSEQRLAVCMVGGGQDGAPLAEAFVAASLPAGIHGVVVNGPFMPQPARQRLHRRAATNPRMTVLDFLREPAPLLDRADRVIAMAGYNSVCDVLSFRKPALIVPRATPRREQSLRAERLCAMGAFEVLPPEQLSPSALSRWLNRDAATPRADMKVDVGGLEKLPGELQTIVGLPRRAPVPSRSLMLAV